MRHKSDYQLTQQEVVELRDLLQAMENQVSLMRHRTIAHAGRFVRLQRAGDVWLTDVLTFMMNVSKHQKGVIEFLNRTAKERKDEA